LRWGGEWVFSGEGSRDAGMRSEKGGLVWSEKGWEGGGGFI